jgi:hypothetical protein
MTNTHNIQRRRTGQALIESAVGMVFTSTLFVLLASFSVNAYFAYQLNASLRTVAQETAKVVQAKRYWLGRLRPDAPSPDQTQAMARQVATTLCQKLRLPVSSSDPFSNFSVAIDASPSDPIDFVTVNLEVRNIALPYAGGTVFPSVIALSASGAAAQPHEDPYAVLNIDAQDPANSNQRLGVQIPVYGYFTGIGSQSVSLGQTSPSTYLSTNGSLPGGFAPLCGGSAKHLAGLPMPSPIGFAPPVVSNNSVVGFVR